MRLALLRGEVGRREEDRKTNLRAELTSFVGKDADVAAVRDRDVAQATLAALRLRDALLGEAPDAEPTERVIAAVRQRAMLLILDNCEHVIESAAAFAHRVLGACRRLRILATSREPLGITGEALWLVAPLVLPAEDADPGEIASTPAVQLLQDRAVAVRKDLTTDAHTLSTLARVCRALDGMPLALELAAPGCAPCPSISSPTGSTTGSAC